jgi:hypothetical protein
MYFVSPFVALVALATALPVSSPQPIASHVHAAVGAPCHDLTGGPHGNMTMSADCTDVHKHTDNALDDCCMKSCHPLAEDHDIGNMSTPAPCTNVQRHPAECHCSCCLKGHPAGCQCAKCTATYPSGCQCAPCPQDQGSTAAPTPHANKTMPCNGTAIQGHPADCHCARCTQPHRNTTSHALLPNPQDSLPSPSASPKRIFLAVGIAAASLFAIALFLFAWAAVQRQRRTKAKGKGPADRDVEMRIVRSTRETREADRVKREDEKKKRGYVFEHRAGDSKEVFVIGDGH